MFISNIYSKENLELTVDDTVLQVVNTHEHLGVAWLPQLNG